MVIEFDIWTRYPEWPLLTQFIDRAATAVASVSVGDREGLVSKRGRKEIAGTSTIKQPGTNRVYIESSSSSLRRSTERDHEESASREKERGRDKRRDGDMKRILTQKSSHKMLRSTMKRTTAPARTFRGGRIPYP